MRTRFQIDVERRPREKIILRHPTDSVHFRVWTSIGAVVSLADYFLVMYDYGTDHWIGSDASHAILRELQAPIHHGFLVIHATKNAIFQGGLRKRKGKILAEHLRVESVTWRVRGSWSSENVGVKQVERVLGQARDEIPGNETGSVNLCRVPSLGIVSSVE